jgi:hypothetical protein
LPANNVGEVCAAVGSVPPRARRADFTNAISGYRKTVVVRPNKTGFNPL